MAIITGVLMIFKLKSFFGFIFKNWKVVLILALVATIGLYHWNRSRIIASLQKEVTFLKQEKAKCEGALQKQNTIINTVTKTGEQLLKEEQKRTTAEVAKTEQDTNNAVNRLRKKIKSTSCQAAINDMVKETKGELKW